MSQNKNAQEKFNQLRRQAEEFIRGNEFVPPTVGSEDPMKLIHELATYQIELEMQNEELRTAQEELEAERSRYFDLYDFAPVGYITLNEQGFILEANLAAADLLGVARKELIKQRLTRFILKEDQDIHYLKHKKFFESEKPQEYELRMVNNAGVQCWTQLTANAAQYAGLPACRPAGWC